MFDIIKESACGPGLDLTYHLTPWDQPVFQGNSGAIADIRLHDAALAMPTYGRFRDWCFDNRTLLISCRLDQERLAECGFLEGQGFRFIELHYRPVINRLKTYAPSPSLIVEPARPDDEAEICAIAAEVFDTGRLHVDANLGPELGRRRYALWAANAFRHADQHVVVCRMRGRLAAFMIFEQPSPTHVAWTLSAVAPDMRGQGIGPRAWRNMLAYHARSGVTQVSSSVSSLNIMSLNLHAFLGFRFPAPAVTLHWCPFGPVPVPIE